MVNEAWSDDRYRQPKEGEFLHPSWPTLTTYSGQKLARVAMPLGGIGTGTVSLGGRGDLRDWEVVNRPAKGFVPAFAFTTIRGKVGDQEPFARCLEGPLSAHEYEGAFGSRAAHHGLPRFRHATFRAAYPLAQIQFEDDGIPLSVRLEAFNPLVPPDADQSGIPVAILRYVVRNDADADAEVSIATTFQNFIGTDGLHGEPDTNRNQNRDDELLSGVAMHSDGLPGDAEQWGTMALAAVKHPAQQVTTRLDWPDRIWGGSLLDFWDDFLADGSLDDREVSDRDAPIASVAAKRTLVPGEETSFTVLIAWHFPNRMSWDVGSKPQLPVGNAYTQLFPDAWSAASHAATNLDTLEQDTVSFVSAVCASDVPKVVQEAALDNLSTLRTQTTFRLPDGTMMGWEGCGDHVGSCHGSCTHVWNYEQATPFLFGALSRSMREVEFLHATDDDGRMSFRADLPLDRATAWPTAAADGQMGCLVKLYRDWQLSGDEEWLTSLWPSARKTMEFCWIPGGWDADQDGVMEGCQHNTMDVEYFGPNPQMEFWYLAALQATAAMARAIGDAQFADRCEDLFRRGSAWAEANLFNGEYYQQIVQPEESPDAIAPGLRHTRMGAEDVSNPDFQLGTACLVDQLVGQFLAHVCDLDRLGSAEQSRATLQSIHRYNFRESLADHFNAMRTFALGDEPATLMATYPRGDRPERPFSYFTEVMTGFEYTAAVHMLYEGMTDDGLELIGAIRSRYDGERRNPFNEAECGHHYARAMASWAAVLALTGFHYSAVTGEFRIRDVAHGASLFWSTGGAWGTWQRDGAGDGTITVKGGELSLERVVIGGGQIMEPGRTTLQPGDQVTIAATA